MKSIMTLVVSAILLSAPLAVQNANAQLELNMGAGLNKPLGDYADEINAGYALTGGLAYRFSPYAALGMEATYNGNKFSDDAMAGLADGYDMSSSIIQYSAVAKLIYPFGNHSMFAKGIVGNYRASAKVSGPEGDGSVTITDFGYGFGAGFQFAGNETTSLLADVTYHSVAFGDGPDNTNYMTFTLGALIKFDLFKPDTRDDLQDDLDKLRE